MRLFKSDMVDWFMRALKVPDDVPIEDKRITKMIQSAQEQVEAQNFEMRKNVLKYDDVMNRQRHAIYSDRRSVLEGADVEEKLRATVTRVVTQFVENATQGFEEDWDLEQLWLDLKQLYPVSLDHASYEDHDVTTEQLVADFTADAQKAYDTREEALTPDVMRELERRVLLTVLDRKWREHLYEMDYLREGIGLRAMAQRDPLVEYQREGYDMFRGMLDGLKEESVGFLFNVAVEVAPALQPAVGRAAAASVEPLPTESAPAAAGRPAAAAAFRAKGLDDEQEARMVFSGPDESGAAAVSAGNGTDTGGADSAGTPGAGSRRDRRAEARNKTRGPKGPKRKR